MEIMVSIMLSFGRVISEKGKRETTRNVSYLDQGSLLRMCMHVHLKCGLPTVL